MRKKCLVLALFIQSYIVPLGMQAQEPQDQTREELRQQIGLDYSMPDYQVSKIDDKVIGTHLAKMLRFLEKNYRDAIYNQYLSKIRSEQMNDLSLRFLGVDKIKVTGVTKKGNEIVVTVQTTSKVSKEISKNKKLITNLHLRFVDGISDSNSTHHLFANLNRYAR